MAPPNKSKHAVLVFMVNINCFRRDIVRIAPCGTDCRCEREWAGSWIQNSAPSISAEILIATINDSVVFFVTGVGVNLF